MDMKAISWVGNIYQKFETMCLEMEESISQDTARYVENQVQTVGASVKKFYSDVMLDLHPQFDIDPVKVAAADLSLNPYAHTEINKKLKANLKRYPRGISKDLIDDTQVIKGKRKSGGVYRRQNGGIKEIARDSHPPSKKPDVLCLISGDAIKLSLGSKVRGGFEVASDHMTISSPLASVRRRNSVEAAKEVNNQVCTTVPPAAGISANAVASDISLSVESVGQSQADLRNIATVPGLRSETHDRCTDKDLAGETGSEISSNTHEDDEEITESCKERSGSHKKYNMIESDVEIVEQLDESELEETCVLVEGDRLHAPQCPIKKKSYKKKLREVFSTKKKLTRKEYVQLGALHGDQQPNLEVEDKAIQLRATKSDIRNLPADDHSESEWELL